MAVLPNNYDYKVHVQSSTLVTLASKILKEKHTFRAQALNVCGVSLGLGRRNACAKSLT